jgi:hypothetical protein
MMPQGPIEVLGEYREAEHCPDRKCAERCDIGVRDRGENRTVHTEHHEYEGTGDARKDHGADGDRS